MEHQTISVEHLVGIESCCPLTTRLDAHPYRDKDPWHAPCVEVAMSRSRLRLLAVAAALVAVVGLAGMQPGDAAETPARVPTRATDCHDGGWRTVVDDQGQPFRNQGHCVSWVIHHPHVFGLSDLTGSFTGTSVFNFSQAGCSFVHQVLDATYPGSNAVGNVMLHVDACVDLPTSGFNPFPMTGTFTITTAVGTLSGTASGSQTVFTNPVPITVTLAPTAGDGVFSAPSGALQMNALWNSSGTAGAPEPITGTVSTA